MVDSNEYNVSENLCKMLISRIGSESTLDQAVDIFFEVISKAYRVLKEMKVTRINIFVDET